MGGAGGIASAARQIVRWWMRKVLYGTPLHYVLPSLRRRFLAIVAHRRPDYWDKALNSHQNSYLGGTYSVDVRNTLTVQIIGHFLPGATSMLDIGCASGTMAIPVHALGVKRYVGVDISQTAIDKADKTTGTYLISDLVSFSPANDETFDIIAFNEVLYYIDVSEAVEQVQRYQKYLSRKGLIIISMKNDPKSQAIICHLFRKMRWVTGFLYQEVKDRPRFRITSNRERPAFLLGAFQNYKRESDNSSDKTSLFF